MVSWLVFLPFVGVILLNVLGRAVRTRIAFGLVLFVVSLEMFFSVYSFSQFSAFVPDPIGNFLRINFSQDALSQVLLFCISLVSFVTLFVQKETGRDDKSMFNFANMLLLILAGMNGIVLVRDIFSLYVFLEVTAISSFILIAFDENFASFEGAFKYIILSIVATVLMLLAIGLLLVMAQGTTFYTLQAAIQTSSHHVLIRWAMGIFLCGCFIKAGLMPFHGWLPDAYTSAPSSVSVLLAGIVTKTVGVYTLMRIVISVFGFDPSLQLILLVVGSVSVVFGALAALGQKDFKRMLAYSSISQVGYIVLGLGAWNLLGLAGALLHLFNHAIFKSLLFVNSAAVESRTGTRHLDTLSGLAQKMPVTGVTSIVASLSAAGLPPLAGFWSKLLIILALWFSGATAVAVIAILASILTLAYFLYLQREVFFGVLAADFSSVREAGFPLTLVSVILASIILSVGLLFPACFSIFLGFVFSLIGGF